MPRWVKVLIIVAVAAALAAFIISLVAGVEHGPGRHGPRRDHAAAAPDGS